MYSILYVDCDIDGERIINIGPKPTEQEAIAAAKEAQHRKDFDIRDQRVYLLHPDHRMADLSEKDLALNSEEIKASYPDGVCPDCGDEIPTDVVDGDACSNCGHVFVVPRPDDGPYEVLL